MQFARTEDAEDHPVKVEAGVEEGHVVSLTGGQPVDPPVSEPAAIAVCAVRWWMTRTYIFTQIP
jgi:hypothetical protein